MSFEKAKKILRKMAGDKGFIIDCKHFIGPKSERIEYAVLIAGTSYSYGETLKEAIGELKIAMEEKPHE